MSPKAPYFSIDQEEMRICIPENMKQLDAIKRCSKCVDKGLIKGIEVCKKSLKQNS